MAVTGSEPPHEVRVSIIGDPALVRTVRLVAAAVARRVGRDEDFVEEVRLAVGEACALLVGEPAGRAAGDTAPVTVALRLSDGLDIAVTSALAVEASDPPHSDVDGMAPWALLRGLIDEFSVVQDASGTRVSMSWPWARSPVR